MQNREVDKSAKEFKRIFSKSQMRVINLLLAAKVFTSEENDATLIAIGIVLNALNKKSDKWIERNISKYYKKGISDTSKFLSSSSLFTAKDKQMIKVLTENAQTSMGDAISGISRSSSRLLNWASQQKIEARIKEGSLSGETLKQITDAVAGKLKNQSVYLIDSAGRKWDAAKYAEMYSQTELMNSYNNGVVNQTKQKGNDLLYITSYAGCVCDACRAWEGKIVSISGKDKRYPSMERPYNDGVFHPRCKHRFRPYIE